MLIFAVLADAGIGGSSPGLSSGLGWLSGLPVAVPEASSLALLIFGLAAVGVAIRRRNARLGAPGIEGGAGMEKVAPGGQAEQG